MSVSEAFQPSSAQSCTFSTVKIREVGRGVRHGVCVWVGQNVCPFGRILILWFQIYTSCGTVRSPPRDRAYPIIHFGPCCPIDRPLTQKKILQEGRGRRVKTDKMAFSTETTKIPWVEYVSTSSTCEVELFTGCLISARGVV